MSHLFEQSAWGIVYRRHGGFIEVLLLKWKNSGGKVVYTLPKWHTKEGEAPEAEVKDEEKSDEKSEEKKEDDGEEGEVVDKKDKK